MLYCACQVFKRWLLCKGRRDWTCPVRGVTQVISVRPTCRDLPPWRTSLLPINVSIYLSSCLLPSPIENKRWLALINRWLCFSRCTQQLWIRWACRIWSPLRQSPEGTEPTCRLSPPLVSFSLFIRHFGQGSYFHTQKTFSWVENGTL